MEQVRKVVINNFAEFKKLVLEEHKAGHFKEDTQWITLDESFDKIAQWTEGVKPHWSDESQSWNEEEDAWWYPVETLKVSKLNPNMDFGGCCIDLNKEA